MSTMQFTVGWLDKTNVTKPEEFAEFVQQVHGTPYPTGKAMAQLRRVTKDFFKKNPKADWMTLCKTVEFCHNRNKRLAQAYSVLPWVRYAWQSGWLPELDPNVSKEIDDAIAAAIVVETDQYWRDKLACAGSIAGKQTAYAQWQAYRAG